MKNIEKIFVLLILTSSLNAQIQLLNDEFTNAATLQANWLNINDTEGWNAEHLEVHDINTSSPGHLYMMPWTSSWFQDWRGTLLHKMVENDFVMTTEVTATNRAGNSFPGAEFSLAGIMIRTPRNFPNGAQGPGGWTAGGENYIFLATGNATGNNGPHFEVKTTENSVSDLQITPISTSQNVRIRLARIDTAIIVLFRLSGQNWQVHQRYGRDDFPALMQIGLVTYTDWDKVFTYTPLFHNSHVLNDSLNPDPSSNPGLPFDPDLIGQFDFVRFDSVTVPPPLQGVDLVNVASNNDLLSFLGYSTQAYCPLNLYIHSDIQNGQIATVSAQNAITADNTVQANADVHITAGQSIRLLPGFQTQNGARFFAEIGSCP